MLIALLDQTHVHHFIARKWFAVASLHGWATCALTENGCIRVLSSPSYSGVRLSCDGVIQLLRTLRNNHAVSHQYWNNPPSLTDPSLVISSRIVGSKQVADIALLAICQHHGGTLVTLDQAIQVNALVYGKSARCRRDLGYHRDALEDVGLGGQDHQRTAGRRASRLCDDHAKREKGIARGAEKCPKQAYCKSDARSLQSLDELW